MRAAFIDPVKVGNETNIGSLVPGTKAL